MLWLLPTWSCWLVSQLVQVGLFGPLDCAVPQLVAKLLSLYFVVVVEPLVGGGRGGHCCSVKFLLTHKFIKALKLTQSFLHVT